MIQKMDVSGCMYYLYKIKQIYTDRCIYISFENVLLNDDAYSTGFRTDTQRLIHYDSHSFVTDLI